MQPCKEHITPNVDAGEGDKYRYVQQRSVAWEKIRQEAKVTGSTMYNALGLGSLKSQLEHFDSVMFNKQKEQVSSDVSTRLKHGTDNEVNASATFTGKFLPVFHSNLCFFEEGCYRISVEKDVCVIVSPDGSCREYVDDQAVFAVECKCPFPGSLYTTPVHYTIPKYYIPQILAEMRCLEVQNLYFVSYSKDSTTFQKATYDKELWEELEMEISEVYHKDALRPNRKRKNSIELSTKLKVYAENNVELVAEMNSIKGYYSNNIKQEHPIDENEAQLDILIEGLINVSRDVERAYNLTRKKASELLGFMISDLDREFSFDQLHSIPIAYGLKGYSLPSSIFEKYDRVRITRMFKKGIIRSSVFF